MIIIQLSSEQLEALIERAVQKALSSKMMSSKDENKSLLNIEQAADFLGLSKQTIYSYTSERKIPHLKRGKKLYFEEEKLIEWLQEGKQKTLVEIQADAQNYMKNAKGGKNGK